MRLYARIQGQLVSLDISPYASVYSLKQLIQTNFQCPVIAQVIYFSGKVLLDKQSLMQVGIYKDVCVLVRLNGHNFVLPSAPPGIGAYVHPSAPPMPMESEDSHAPLIPSAPEIIAPPEQTIAPAIDQNYAPPSAPSATDLPPFAPHSYEGDDVNVMEVVPEGPSEGDGCCKAWGDSPHLKSIFLTVAFVFVGLVFILSLVNINLFGNFFDTWWHGLALLGGIYLLYLIEMGCSSTWAYLSHSYVKEGCEQFVRNLTATRPSIRWHIQCYHYETRTRTVTYTDSDGKTRTRTETYQERVNTHRATGYFQFKSFLDVSGEITGLEHYKLTRIRMRKEWTFADQWTEQAFRTQKSDFIRYNDRDRHYDFSESFEINGFTPRVLCEVQPETKHAYMTNGCYFFFSIILCSACFRCWFNGLTGKKTFYIIKQLSIFDPAEIGAI